MTAAIRAEGLTKTYPPRTVALSELRLAVDTGTVFALLGSNGAGKSTTVKLLTTLTRPTAGTATVAGFDVATQPQRVRGAIGCVVQRGTADLWASGRENLQLHGELCNVRGRPLTRRIDELIEQFHLTGDIDRPVRAYSGGMQRRLEVAMALVHQPQVLFLDEPTTGLDPEVRASLWRDVAELVRSRGTTVLLTTHNLTEADQVADRIGILHRGSLVRHGTPAELKRELAGDVVSIEFDGGASAERARDCLAAIDAICDLKCEGHALQARVNCGATALTAIMGRLALQGPPILSVRVQHASLDDVYRRYALSMSPVPGVSP